MSLQLFTLEAERYIFVYCRYMVTSGLDRKLKVYDIRALKPLHSYFLPAGASYLSLSQKGLLSAATGDIVQVGNLWERDVFLDSLFLKYT